MSDIWARWSDRHRYIGVGIQDFTYRHYMDIELDADRAARNIAFGLALVAAIECGIEEGISIADHVSPGGEYVLREAGLWKERK